MGEIYFKPFALWTYPPLDPEHEDDGCFYCHENHEDPTDYLRHPYLCQRCVDDVDCDIARGFRCVHGHEVPPSDAYPNCKRCEDYYEVLIENRKV